MSASTQLTGTQVIPLAISSGRNTPSKQQMSETNTLITMLKAQSNTNTKYDPAVPQPVTAAVVIDGFCSGSTSSILMVIGGLLCVYGIIAK